MSDVQELLEELAGAGPARGAAAVFGGAIERASQRRRARRLRGAASVLAVLAVIVVVGLAVRSSGTNHRNGQIGVRGGATTTTTGSATAAQLAAGHWSTLPTPPIEPAYGATVVWTGKEMIVWSPANDGVRARNAAYDPSTRTWRVLPQSPLTPRVNDVVVWTGSELVTWGGLSYPPETSSRDARARQREGAAYRPSTNTWRRIADAPTPSGDFATGVWTGDRVVVLSGLDVAAYDPETDGWQRLPSIPAPSPLPSSSVESLGVRVAVAAGPGRILAWSQSGAVGALAPNDASPGTDVFRYDELSNRWTELSAGPDEILQPEEAVWTGDRIVVRGEMRRPDQGPLTRPEVFGWYDPDTGSVTRLPARPDALPPDYAAVNRFSSVWTGAALWSFEPGGVVQGEFSDARVYDAKTDTWQTLPRATSGCYQPASIWTGKTILVYCSLQVHTAEPDPIRGLEFIPG